MLNKQIDDLHQAALKGNYSDTWKIVHDLSGNASKKNVKVKRRDEKPPSSTKDLLSEWKEYFSTLLNNDNGQTPSDPPPVASQDLQILADPPTLEETQEAIFQMKTNKAACLECNYSRGTSK